MDPELNRQIKSAYEEGDYPLPDIGAEWEKFADTLPASAGQGVGGTTLIKLAGVLLVVATGVVAYLLIQNRASSKSSLSTAEMAAVNTGSKEIGKGVTDNRNLERESGAKELLASSALTSDKNERMLYRKQNTGSSETGVKTENRSNRKTNGDGSFREEVSFKEEMKSEQKEKAAEVKEVAKEEKENSSDTAKNAFAKGNKNDASEMNKEATLLQDKPEQKDSVPKIKPVKERNNNNNKYRNRAEFYVNTSNALNSRMTVGGGLMRGWRQGNFSLAGGAMFGNRSQNISYIDGQKITLYRTDTPTVTFIHKDSFRMNRVGSYYIGIPVEISWQGLKNFEIYGRMRTDFMFRQKYNYMHYQNYTDSGLLTGTGDYFLVREEKSSYRAFQTNLLAQTGLRYNYRRFSLGLCASRTLYSGSLTTLEKHLKSQGMQMGQRFADKIYYSFTLGCLF